MGSSAIRAMFEQRLPTKRTLPALQQTATRSCFRNIDRISRNRDPSDCASNAGEHLVDSAVRKKQWELGTFALFPCPTMDAVPQKHQGGTVKQVLALCASPFREKSSRLLGARHRNPPLVIRARPRCVALCFSFCMDMDLSVGYCVHGSVYALGK
jgi:hypothetical protein